MAVVRKVQSKLRLSSTVEGINLPKTSQAKEDEVVERKDLGDRKAEAAHRDNQVVKKKYCHFCKTKTEPHYWEATALRRLINDRGRIAPRQRVGTCAKHQRRVSKEIKRARHLALLPFTIRI